MNAVVSRRVFVGSVASGLPLLAGGASVTTAAAAGQHDHGVATERVDSTFDHIAAEVAAIVKRGQTRGFTSEDARAIAAQLRAAVVRSTQLGIDAPVQNAVRDLISRQGRDAVLQLEVNEADMAAHLTRYGIKTESRRVETHALDSAERDRVIDGLVSGGISGVFVGAAGLFESCAAALDFNEGRRGGVRRVQYDPNTRFIFCAQLGAQIQMLEAQAIVVCALGTLLFDSALLGVCATLWGTIYAQYGLYWALCF